MKRRIYAVGATSNPRVYKAWSSHCSKRRFYLCLILTVFKLSKLHFELNLCRFEGLCLHTQYKIQGNSEPTPRRKRYLAVRRYQVGEIVQGIEKRVRRFTKHVG